MERRFGSIPFLLLLIFITFLSGIIQILLANLLSEMLEDPYYITECSIGFSGVIFALKVIVHHYDHQSIKMPIWTELILIQLLAPNSSFIGHLSGILAGYVFIQDMTPLFYILKPLTYPATTLTSVFLTSLHFDLISKPWTKRHFWQSGSSLVCLNARHIIEKRNFLRIISAPVEHAGDVHLAICVLSFVIKVRQRHHTHYFIIWILSLNSNHFCNPNLHIVTETIF